MRILSKAEFKKLMKSHPDGGIVFADYYPASRSLGRLHVTVRLFRAIPIIPYNHLWDIDNYTDDESFAVLNNDDILLAIQNLTSGLKIDLTFDIPKGDKNE